MHELYPQMGLCEGFGRRQKMVEQKTDIRNAPCKGEQEFENVPQSYAKGHIPLAGTNYRAHV